MIHNSGRVLFPILIKIKMNNLTLIRVDYPPPKPRLIKAFTLVCCHERTSYTYLFG